jgi:hypothetical protein
VSHPGWAIVCLRVQSCGAHALEHGRHYALTWDACTSVCTQLQSDQHCPCVHVSY